MTEEVLFKNNGRIIEGANAIIYKISNQKTGKEYILKRNIVPSSDFIASLKEADFLNMIPDHPHVISIRGFYTKIPFENGVFSPINGRSKGIKFKSEWRDDSLHFIFEKGICDLFAFIHQNQNHMEKKFKAMKSYMLQILLGLSHIHSMNIIHRDLKDTNLIIFKTDEEPFKEEGIIKICDFGHSKYHYEKEKNSPNASVTEFRAPEMLLEKSYSFPVDIWALGLTFWEMVIGTNLFPKNLSNGNKVIEEIFRQIISDNETDEFKKFILKENGRLNFDIKRYNGMIMKRSESNSKLKEIISKFEEETGNSILEFEDLLSKMLKYNPEERWTATQCLKHPFFNDPKLQKYVDETQNHQIGKNPISFDTKLQINDCTERFWISEVVIDIYNRRYEDKKLSLWYKNQIIFQSLNLFDIFLADLQKNKEISPEATETDEMGLYLSKKEAIQKFFICIYIYIKYFTMQMKLTFKEIIPENLISLFSDFLDEDAEIFERKIVIDLLNINLLNPTIYEAINFSEKKFLSQDVANILTIYLLRPDLIEGKTIGEFLESYTEKLSKLTNEELFGSS